MAELQDKHRLAIRWTHWVNFPILSIMIWSGLLIYWSNDVYRIGLGGTTLFHFFPKWVYDLFNMDHRLAEGMAIHFLFMWLFAVNGIVYILYTLISDEWRLLVPDRHSFRDALQVVLYDLKISKQLPPQRKYNAAQKIAYSSIILMGAGSLITGLAIYKPTQVAWLTGLLGGYDMARWEHFWLTMGYVAFFVVHIAQVVKAGWNNFQAMVTGFDMPASAPVEAKEARGE